MERQVRRFGTLMRVFNQMYHTGLRQAFDRAGLAELSNPKILFILREEPELTQREIADRLGLTPPTVTMSIKRMERVGLLQKEADESDLRKSRIRLTRKGQELTRTCERAGDELLYSMVQGFDESELEQMCGCYLRMVRRLEETGVRMPSELNKEVE